MFYTVNCFLNNICSVMVFLVFVFVLVILLFKCLLALVLILFSVFRHSKDLLSFKEKNWIRLVLFRYIISVFDYKYFVNVYIIFKNIFLV